MPYNPTNVDIQNYISSLGPVGLAGTSGLVGDNNASATQILSSDLAPVNISEADQRSRNFGLGLNIRDTDTNFDRSIEDNETREQNSSRSGGEDLLNAQQRDLLYSCISDLQSQVCGVAFNQREDLIECADKIFDRACALEDKLLERIQCQIEDAKCQFFRQATARWELVSRAVGSSRNTFVLQQQDTAMIELTRRLAELAAKLENDAILQSQQSLVQAFSVKAVSRIDNYNASYGNLLSMWQILRGSRRDYADATNDNAEVNRTSSEDSFQDVTTFDWAGKYAEKVTQTTGANGVYDADYQNANALVGLLGIITP